MARHSLSAKDLTAREAVCSVCGPTAIRPNGPAKWICANKKKSAEAAWRAANPAKVRLSRDKKSEHHLATVHTDRTGWCPIDGLVSVVSVGRGWMCGVRAAQLGWTGTAGPVPQCETCIHWESDTDPLVDGHCTHCRPGYEFREFGRTEVPDDDDAPRSEAEDWYWANADGAAQVNLRSYEEGARVLPKSRLGVLGDPNVPPEWEWALDPKADWTAFDEEASRANATERIEVFTSGWADIGGGAPFTTQDEFEVGMTLLDHYPRLADEGETFAEFKTRFIDGLVLAGADPRSSTVRKLLDIPEEADVD